MKMRPTQFLKMAASALLALPLLAHAVPTDSPYYTDTVNSYVRDQVSNDMEGLNNLLCMLSAMAPHLMVNGGDYISLIDQNSCQTSEGSGGQGNNTGADYMSAQVSSIRTSNTSPMVTKIWFDLPQEDMRVPMYSTASRAPSKSLPYGIFRMDYCVQTPATPDCDGQRAFINATTEGLAFYTSSNYWSSAQSRYVFRESILQLSSTSSSNSGRGVVVKYNGDIPPTPTVTVFAYSPDYFYRDDGSLANGASGQCFSRSTRYAEESAWRYGLYDATTGERFMHKSGFPLEYTDTSVTPNVTYNGYIGYYGLSMYTPTSLPANATVNQISYDTNPPTKTPYTLVQAGGKLTKYSTVIKPLSALNKLPIWYYMYSSTPIVTTSITMTSGNYYQIYWDATNQQFYVSGAYNNITYNMEPLATHGAIANADLVAADIYGWGLSGWSQLVGGNFSIKGTDFALLATTLSTTNVITQTQDVIYPQDFAAINAAGGLKCIGDCPDSSLTMQSPGWGPFTSLRNYSYTLDASTGNMIDSITSLPVVSSASSIYSGRLVTETDAAAIEAIKPACTPPCFSQSDIDLLTAPTYYEWRTSSSSWDQMAFLKDQSNNYVIFYPPLPMNFNVPNTTAYGDLAGSTITLEYGEFGNLWGIPNKCVDARNNTDCIYGDDPATTTVVEVATPSEYQYWAPQFSIPTDTTAGVVTAGIDQGTITQGTQFLVKSLDKEVRLSKVNKNLCLVLGLTEPVSISRLATYSDWIDPRPLIGTKPVLNPMPAPRVIHGVKQY